MVIDPQLLADCHVLGALDRATLLLHRNASVGWLILVPETEAVDWHQLDDAEHDHVTLQTRNLSAFAAAWFAADKMNVAALGNSVRQMHVHLIARHTHDACWPQPVWGHLQTVEDYALAQVTEIREALARDLDLVPGGEL